MNSTVFYDASITSVTAVTEVFGDSQNVTAAIVELAAPVKAGSLPATSFIVDDRTVTAVKVAARADVSAPEADGRFVILALDPADEASVVFGANIDRSVAVAVHMTGPISAEGVTLEPGAKGVLSTRVQNLIVDDFQTFRFTDPESGLQLDYNLYIPEGYDPAKSYPLVMFLHDAGVTGSNPRRTLQQGLGAVSFASPEDQARHPSFVLAPQIPAALVNDAAQVSPYVEMLPRLLTALQQEYSIDANRLYTTGQSGGCMTSLALGIRHPDLFAATLCVAGQWDPAIEAPPTGAFWGVVSEDDAKAFPGMGAIMDAVEASGKRVVRGTLDAKADPSEMAAAVAEIRAGAGEAEVYFTPFVAGSVLLNGQGGGGAGHVRTWIYAYDIPAIRDWLFEQSR
ncbi:prolyl oligopeptidase family serine peptidase [Gemmobacter aquaticus]|nr:pyrroline-5-carboxylate reductase [Gemmobacter aquaticus]